MNHRIIGFDLARAYAILGMFIVNFNTVFGSHKDQSWLGKFLNLFNGNSSSTFVILAGMGVALMTNRNSYNGAERKRLQSIVIKRSWFLLFTGLLLFLWWSADILHFYGYYMHIAALLLFVPKKYYLLGVVAAIVIFHTLLLFIPYENGWHFDSLVYIDFWTVKGFLRNTFYNGWNLIFPWIAYFFLGMWLGRLNWNDKVVRKKIFVAGLTVTVSIEALQLVAVNGYLSESITFYSTSDYIPPFLRFMLHTAAFALMLLVICMYVGDKLGRTKAMQILSKTG